MNNGLKGKKVLITGGPTSVPIDEMRVITNRSTGEMGRLIANDCAKKGAKVTLLEGAVTTTVLLARGIRVVRFCFFDELDRLLRAELKKQPDVVFHAAAVSDFALRKSYKGKLSSGDQLSLDLVPTKKLIAGIRKIASRTKIVAFKFEPTMSLAIAGAKKVLQSFQADCVVANVSNSGKYRAVIVAIDGALSPQIGSKKVLVKELISKIASL